MKVKYLIFGIREPHACMQAFAASIQALEYMYKDAVLINYTVHSQCDRLHSA